MSLPFRAFSNQLLTQSLTIMHVLLAIMPPLFTNAQNNLEWKQKIDPVLLQEMNDGRYSEFLVIFKEQPSTDAARSLWKKEDKGRFVYKKLSETATGTQKIALGLVQEKAKNYKSFWIINAIWAEGNLELASELAKLPEVKEIQSNPKVHFEEPVREQYAGGLRAIAWGITNIKANEVHYLGFTGQGVVIGGQDTGYEWSNSSLKSKYSGWNSTASTVNHNFNWHDAIHANAKQNSCGFNSPTPCDDNGHGTHTMGTMVGENTKDTFGVAPGAKWIACRNMDNGDGTPATYIECFEWFVAPYDLNGLNPKPELAPHVINNSWSCPASEGCNLGNYATMNAVINNVRNAGIVVAVSAGNSGPNCFTISAPPAIFDGSFSVGATNVNDSIAAFSSRGPVRADSSYRMKPNVSAPGVGVFSCLRNGAFASLSGTSMAAPHVTGAVALMISANPYLAGQVDLIEQILESTARKKPFEQICGNVSGTTFPNNTFGYGIIDAYEAVRKSIIIRPVKVLSVKAWHDSPDNYLLWNSSHGGSLNHFEIQYSTDNKTFKTIGSVPYSPILNGQGTYKFVHQKPGYGIHFYVLKLVDINGNYEYSDTVSIQVPEENSTIFFPNPVSDVLSIRATIDQPDEVSIQIFDAGGKLILEKATVKIGDITAFDIDVSSFSSGLYFFRIIESEEKKSTLSGKFMKL